MCIEENQTYCTINIIKIIFKWLSSDRIKSVVFHPLRDEMWVTVILTMEQPNLHFALAGQMSQCMTDQYK